MAHKIYENTRINLQVISNSYTLREIGEIKMYSTEMELRCGVRIDYIFLRSVFIATPCYAGNIVMI
jgi:hypothetical protein